MNRVKRVALLTCLMDELKEKGSWCGETHIQKAVYVAQEVMRLPTEYEFIFYKHGPFSFDLRDELTALRADKIVEIEPRGRYGPKIVTTQSADRIWRVYPKTLARYRNGMEFVAGKMGAKDVTGLEQLTTAVYVRRKKGGAALSVEEASRRIVELKPHIAGRDAIAAVEEADKLLDGARAAGLAAA